MEVGIDDVAHANLVDEHWLRRLIDEKPPRMADTHIGLLAPIALIPLS